MPDRRRSRDRDWEWDLDRRWGRNWRRFCPFRDSRLCWLWFFNRRFR